VTEQDILKLGKKLGLIDSIKIADLGRRKETLEAVRHRITKIGRDLDTLYSFLSKNAEYNAHVQHMAYVSVLKPWSGNYDRISSLLHSHMQLQASPSLDDMSKTCQNLFQHRESFDAVRSPAALLAALRNLSDCSRNVSGSNCETFDCMWHVVKDIPGFGPKTAALLIKAVIDVHTLEVNRNLRFLDGFCVLQGDFVRVPVDAVIQYIFNRLTGRILDFDTINQLIFKIAGRDSAEATTWDDLWFWGFITQHGGGDKRKLAINEAKFWTIFGSPKNKWNAVRQRAGEFIEILSECEVSQSIILA